ncbi:MAG: nucleoside triphosphate pyrophosphohydrolase [Acidobacteria bacterium]|nr:MAG: nucleoside triphosphate pyrophosphohydrolase [Acidobacteriota bacterium]
MTTGQRFERAVEIMHRLRAPGGCPWDREQTFDSIKKHTVEETYEVLEAIENRDWDELPGELGDLLLQVLFYAEMAEEQGHFSIDNVLETLSNKLVRRHPHVFGDVEAETSREVLKNWEAIKTQEKAQKAAASGEPVSVRPKPLLESVSSAMPALLEGLKLSKKAAQVGFDWPSIEGLFDKLHEEAAELRQEVDRIPEPGPQAAGRGLAGARGGSISPELHSRLQDEVGDLLFTVVNLARYLEVDPESALRQTNRKFRRRFGHVELRLREEGKELADASLEEMEKHWQNAKRSE